jgi:hypothetical protein
MESKVWRHGRLQCEAAQGLEEENNKLKRLLADALLDNAVLKMSFHKV